MKTDDMTPAQIKAEDECLAELTDTIWWYLQDRSIPWERVAAIAEMLPGEIENRNEAAYDRQQAALMESGGIDDTTYRRQMKEAGRERQLR